ncbi:MAG: hypothetical protein IJ879_01430, partial [Muribaculaceae bacterium]|nr:hypothetical protein [Muribaculaceae bacterium]
REKEALEFLYAYMPLADVTDYTVEFHLANVRATFKALDEMRSPATVAHYRGITVDKVFNG